MNDLSKGRYIWESEDGKFFKDYDQEEDRIKERTKKIIKQRKKTGVGDDETYDLSFSLCVFLLPRLKRFREVTIGYPFELTEKKWDSILGEMIWFCEEYINGYAYDLDKDVKKNKRFLKASKLLSKYFLDLWW